MKKRRQLINTIEDLNGEYILHTEDKYEDVFIVYQTESGSYAIFYLGIDKIPFAMFTRDDIRPVLHDKTYSSLTEVLEALHRQLLEEHISDDDR